MATRGRKGAQRSGSAYAGPPPCTRRRTTCPTPPRQLDLATERWHRLRGETDPAAPDEEPPPLPEQD
ncbi:hypothetical protein ACFWFZ_13475 [Streptomyces sp. NPDC060232]|uniref:hypothetical protein n=1 Tax=Streptomyces sp. NPDC060232 TaxID=3347079 RepID=UPI003662D875